MHEATHLLHSDVHQLNGAVEKVEIYRVETELFSPSGAPVQVMVDKTYMQHA